MKISTICDASGTVSDPMDGTCKCGNDPFCNTPTKPSCLLTSNGQVPDVGDTDASCQVYRNLILFHNKGMTEFLLTGIYFIVASGKSNKIIFRGATASTL